MQEINKFNEVKDHIQGKMMEYCKVNSFCVRDGKWYWETQIGEYVYTYSQVDKSSSEIRMGHPSSFFTYFQLDPLWFAEITTMLQEEEDIQTTPIKSYISLDTAYDILYEDDDLTYFKEYIVKTTPEVLKDIVQYLEYTGIKWYLNGCEVVVYRNQLAIKAQGQVHSLNQETLRVIFSILRGEYKFNFKTPEHFGSLIDRTHFLDELLKETGVNKFMIRALGADYRGNYEVFYDKEEDCVSEVVMFKYLPPEVNPVMRSLASDLIWFNEACLDAKHSAKASKEELKKVQDNIPTKPEPPMLYDPTNGLYYPYPSSPSAYREYHGKLAWLYNPYTGTRRTPEDIGTDVFGYLIKETVLA